ncbi:unnamed protein product [Dibothriocephalus latus]|uniref:GIY-YIG domain-containing protein n=1 Tax=Dibothriocephalus latus TaxID=60516 RepID=A0A3P6PIW5_DIBLA|nr:unnamed protein product [Dibothriocephalus latus]
MLHLSSPTVWRAPPYVKNVSKAVSRLLTPHGVGDAQRPEATTRGRVMRLKDPLPWQAPDRALYSCSCGQRLYFGENGRLLWTRMTEHTTVVRRKYAYYDATALLTGSGHSFKFNEAEILAKVDNHVSRDLLESWFSGPPSVNKYDQLQFPYSVMRHCLGRRISHVERSGPCNNSDDNEHKCRAIIKPAYNTNNENAAINDSKAKSQAITAPIMIPSGGYRS